MLYYSFTANIKCMEQSTAKKALKLFEYRNNGKINKGCSLKYEKE